MKNQPVLERFFDKVVIDAATGCWNFTSSISKTNNGRFYYNYKCRDAYKIGYILMGGEIPAGYDLHHTCENRLCVNPEHLLPVTRATHYGELTPHHIAYKNKRKTHCPKGHPYTEDNLVTSLRHQGRWCRICAVQRSNDCQKRKRQREKAAGKVDKRFKANK